MKKIFVFNGCSQTGGKEVLKDNPEALDPITRNHTWAKHLQMLMNPEGTFVNLGTSGSSNESIFRNTVDWLANNQDALQDVFVAIMWTEPNRFEFQCLDGYPRDVIAGQIKYKNAEEKYLNTFANEYLNRKKLTQLKSFNLMLSMEYLLTSFGVPFIFLNGFKHAHFYNPFDIFHYSAYGKLSKYKAKKEFIDDEYCICNVLDAAGFESTKGLHYYEDAHKYYANYIYERLGELT